MPSGSAGPAWPHYESDTCLNRKTIIAALERLSEHGLIIDNEERKGRTNQIIVYRVGHGAPNSPEFNFDLWYERLVRRTVFGQEEARFCTERVPKFARKSPGNGTRNLH